MLRARFAFPLAFLFSVSVFAAPSIDVDKTTFDCGTVIEGKTPKLHASFVVRNTGTEVLRISKVRPGCGCTVATYDSVIGPGKTGLIQADVNIAGVHGGSLKKSLTVTSNAANTPSLQLDILAVVKQLVEISDVFLTLSPADAVAGHGITISAAKPDLNVTEVSFKPAAGGDNTGWASETGMPVVFKWAAKDSVRNDGYKTYVLTLFPPRVEKELSGDLIIKTNHPEKAALSINGRIAAK